MTNEKLMRIKVDPALAHGSMIIEVDGAPIRVQCHGHVPDDVLQLLADLLWVTHTNNGALEAEYHGR